MLFRSQGAISGAAVLNNVLYTTISDHDVYSTTDGSSWLPKNLSVSVGQLVVANGALWTVDGLGKVQTSTDGVTWQTVGSAASIITGMGACEARVSYGFSTFTPPGESSSKLVIVGGSEYCAGNSDYFADVWMSPP